MCLLALLLSWGCKAKVQSEMEISSNRTVTFLNAVRDADVWILPRTAANLKTTVWGMPTIPKSKTGEPRRIPLSEPGDGGLYIFRMIDEEGFFYSADGIALEDGWRMKIEGEDLPSIFLEVSDGEGVSRNTRAVFAARL